MISPVTHEQAATSHSTVLEKTLEHRFLADLCSYLWTCGVYDFAVSQSEVDLYGYDVIVEAAGTIRHIQLKLARTGSRRRHVSLNNRLAQKQSGCVVWMFYKPQDLTIDHYLWFGSAPGEPLPALGDKVTRHAKGNAEGVKTKRPAHRDVAKGRFDRVPTVGGLAQRLFGPLEDAAR
jgi:hypothetical protein